MTHTQKQASFAGISAKDMITLAKGEKSVARLGEMLLHATTKHQRLVAHHPSRAKRWERTAKEINNILAPQPVAAAATFTSAPLPAKKPKASKAKAKAVAVNPKEEALAQITELLRVLMN